MTASFHLAGGAAAGILAQGILPSDSSNIEKIAISFGAGFLSHLLLDAFPHQEYSFGGAKLGLMLFLEITAILVLLLSPSNSLLVNAVIFFGMVGGAMPDMIELAYIYVLNWSWLGNLGSAAHFFHGDMPTGLKVNLYFQALITIVAVIFVKSQPA